MNYRSFADLSKQAHALAEKLPKDVDLIVGVPRSGLLAANLVSLFLNLPLTDLEGLFEHRLFTGGERLSWIKANEFFSEPKKIVVIDDSLASGSQLIEVKNKINSQNFIHEIIYAVIFIKPGKMEIVDYYAEIVPGRRFFEWNILNLQIIESSCVDIDGVLCRDPSDEENDDGPIYLDFIKNVKPFFKPKYPIGWLVTCRLEKYRKETENWLKRNDIQYKQLIMMDVPDKETRKRFGSHAKFKADTYKRSGAILFIESSYKQAKEIGNITKKPVFCVENWELIPKTKIIIQLRNKLFRKKKQFINWLNR